MNGMKRKTGKMSVSLLLVLTVLLCGFAALAEDFPFTAIGGDAGAKLRNYPGTGGTVIGTLQAGELITVTGRQGDWYTVTGPVSRAYVSVGQVRFFSKTTYNPIDMVLVWNPEYAASYYSVYPQAAGVEQHVSTGRRGANLYKTIGTSFTFTGQGDPFRTGQSGGSFQIGDLKNIETQDNTPVTLHANTEVYVFCLVRAGDNTYAVVRYGSMYGYVDADYLDWSTAW